MRLKIEDGLHGDVFLSREVSEDLPGVLADTNGGALHVTFLL